MSPTPSAGRPRRLFCLVDGVVCHTQFDGGVKRWKSGNNIHRNSRPLAVTKCSLFRPGLLLIYFSLFSPNSLSLFRWTPPAFLPLWRRRNIKTDVNLLHFCRLLFFIRGPFTRLAKRDGPAGTCRPSFPFSALDNLFIPGYTTPLFLSPSSTWCLTNVNIQRGERDFVNI